MTAVSPKASGALVKSCVLSRFPDQHSFRALPGLSALVPAGEVRRTRGSRVHTAVLRMKRSPFNESGWGLVLLSAAHSRTTPQSGDHVAFPSVVGTPARHLPGGSGCEFPRNGHCHLQCQAPGIGLAFENTCGINTVVAVPGVAKTFCVLTRSWFTFRRIHSPPRGSEVWLPEREDLTQRSNGQ